MIAKMPTSAEIFAQLPAKTPTAPQPQDIFTPIPVVRHMSDLCEPLLSNPTRKVFEPGCGIGNFLAEALTRRLETSSDPAAALVALSNLYGADSNPDYLVIARARLRDLLAAHFADRSLDYRFWPLADLFLSNNLVLADLLKHPGDLTFIDWQPLSNYNFRAAPTTLASLLPQELQHV